MWIVTGLSLFLWVGVEDRSRGFVLGVALLIALSLALSLWYRIDHAAGAGGSKRLVIAAVLGAGAGFLWPLIAGLLILMKISLHTHPVPDFEVGDLRALLESVPWRAGIGTFIGLGLGVMSLASESDSGQSNRDHFGG